MRYVSERRPVLPASTRWLLVLVVALLAAGAMLLWCLRDSLRSPAALYREAQGAAPWRAVQLYDRLAVRVPELGEYGRLWSAELRLPAYDAVATLDEIARYRPDSPAAYQAHLALARYYAGIESPETVAQYKAALALEDSVAVRLELARYLEEQNAPAAAYQQYLLMLGRDRPDASLDLRRTGSDPLAVARDLLSRRYCRDALDALRETSGPQAHCLRAEALSCLGQDAAAEQAACQPLPEDQGGGAAGNSAGAPAPSDPLEQWKATWDLDAQGRVTEVIPIYLSIAERKVYVSDDAAYRAWVLARRSGDGESESRALALLRSMQPNWLARRATGDLAFEFAPPYPPEATEMLVGEALSKVAALEALGREDLAILELRFIGRVSETPEVLFVMARELAQRGQLTPAYSLAAAYTAAHPFAPQEFWQLAYPRAYEAEVAASATEYRVPPEMVWAVMRQESAYAPEAVSPAGALGLMQVMPATMQELNQLFNTGYAPGDAFLPGPNIDVCTRYLGQLIERYGGDVDLALIAYNAGPGTMDEWLKLPEARDRDDLLRFLPYGETREYLERVELDAAMYGEVYR